MSRIDEALRRADGPRREGAAVAANADVFVSPWMTGRERDPQPTPLRAPVTRLVEQKKSPVRAPVVVPAPPVAKEFREGWRERLAVSKEADQLLVHQFRRLVATLLQAQGTAPLKTVMVTSAAPGDGKTLTALNLAMVLSESYGRQVLLVEGDLRRPAICAAAGLPTTTDGLSDVIKAPDDRKVPLIKLSDSLTVMPAGQPDPDPLSGLTSPRIERLIKEASEEFDWVIIDTPPLGAAPDASLMAPLVDAVLLVIRAAQTPHAIVQHAIESLGPERILGVVLNGVGSDVATKFDNYYGHYSPQD
jgi:receptor protein-tyrosine kinase